MEPLCENGSIHRFDPRTGIWVTLTPSSPSSPFPCARSYHSSCPTPTGLIVHAGCGDKTMGRLKDTWHFDIPSRQWTPLADGPGDPRGGTAIAYDAIRAGVWRFGGYNGVTELGGMIDFLPLTFEESTRKDGTIWQTKPDRKLDQSTVNASSINSRLIGPLARSVSALHVIHGKVITMFGEGKPSPTGGHDAAGSFHSDVWAYDAESDAWEELDDLCKDGKAMPAPRGWFGSDVGERGIVIWGGLNDANERIADGWLFENARGI